MLEKQVIRLLFTLDDIGHRHDKDLFRLGRGVIRCDSGVSSIG